MKLNWVFLVVIIIIVCLFIYFLYRSFKYTPKKNRSYKGTIALFAFYGPLVISIPIAIAFSTAEDSIGGIVMLTYFLIFMAFLMGVIPAAIAGGCYHYLIDQRLDKGLIVNGFYKTFMGVISGFMSSVFVFGSAMIFFTMSLPQASIFMLFSIISGGVCGRLANTTAILAQGLEAANSNKI
jgi:hypothetical protein